MPKDNRYIVIAGENARGTTVKNYLKQSEGFSSRFVTKISKNGTLFVNKKKVFSCYPLSTGDVIELILPKEETFLEAVDIPVNIIFEDEDLLVANKAPYMVVHPTPSHKDDTLANGLCFHFQKSSQTAKPHFINRLDMNTSGIVVVAKNKHAHHFVQTQGQKGLIKKQYLAICHGEAKEKQGLIDAPIERDFEGSLERVVRTGGKESKTIYEILASKDDFHLVRLTLLTGRTHQIRVHMKHIGLPVISDDIYYPFFTDIIPRQALHARKMEFVHPKTKESMSFVAPVPDDFILAMEKLKIEYKQ